MFYIPGAINIQKITSVLMHWSQLLESLHFFFQYRQFLCTVSFVKHRDTKMLKELIKHHFEPLNADK